MHIMVVVAGIAMRLIKQLHRNASYYKHGGMEIFHTKNAVDWDSALDIEDFTILMSRAF